MTNFGREILMRNTLRGIALFALGGMTLPAWGAAGLEQFSESRSDTADWTIAVYLDADNDLEKFGLMDIDEMELGLRGNVNVIVLIDRAEGYDTADGDWTDARVYRVVPDQEKGVIRSSVIARPGEVNMGDPAVLQAFVATTLKSFPAKRTALILWNHGGGWQAHAVDHGVPGRPGATDALTLPQLAAASRGALADAGRTHFDIIGFDMCLMAQYEAAIELAGVARVLVASQATEPGDGWPYDRVLPAFGDAAMPTNRLAVHVVETFDAYYREREEGITTLSAYDLSHLPDFMARFDALLAKLEPALPKMWPVVSRAIFFAEGYAPRLDLQRSNKSLASIDLLDALRRMELNARDFPARGEMRAFEQSFQRMVLTSKASPIRRLSNGVAIYAPVTAAVLDESYNELAINRDTRWRRFVDRLHSLQAAGTKAPVIRNLALVDYKAEKPIDAALPLNTHGVSYVVDGTNLLWLSGVDGLLDDDGESLLITHRGNIYDANWSIRARDKAADQLDLMLPQFADGPNAMVTRIDGTRLLVSSGDKAFYATVDETSEYIQVPILFHHPEAGDLGGTIYFHPEWWYSLVVELELPQADGSIVYRQIKPEPGDEITLLFERLTKEGAHSFTRGRRMAWEDGPELLLGLQEPGSHIFGLTAEAIGGQAAFARFEYELGEDSGLKSFMELGGNFELDDLLGRWEMVEPEPLVKSGQFVPIGLVVDFERHPEKTALMISTTTAPRHNPNFAQRELIYLDLRLVKHLRSFKIDTVGIPDDPMGVKFSVNLVGVYMQEGRPIMLQRNRLTGLNYAFAKVSQPASAQGGAPAVSPQAPGAFGQAPPPQPPPPAPQPQMQRPPTLDGVWQRHDGVILLVQGNQFQINQYGIAIDAGMFVIQGDMLATQSAHTGQYEQYRFSLEGNVLRFQDAWGGQYVYQRLQ
jgi:hypothetical protein